MDEESDEIQFSAMETGTRNDGAKNKSVSNWSTVQSHNFDTIQKPIVFTTRLDDMCVFEKNLKCLMQLNSDELEEAILGESKPTLTLDAINRPEPYKNKLMSYLQFKFKVTEFYMKGKNKNQRMRKKRKIETGKQRDSIVINISSSDDEPETLTSSFVEKKDLMQVKEKNITSLSPSLSRKLEEASNKPVKGNMSYEIDKRKKFRSVYVMINDVSSNVTDIYYLNVSGKVTRFHKMKTNNLDGLNLNNGRAEHIKVNPCCWYQREECIKSFGKFCSNTALRFFKKSHNCPLGKCTCCCKKYKNDIVGKTSSDIIVLDDMPNDKDSNENKNIAFTETIDSLICELEENIKKNVNAPKQTNIVHRESFMPLGNLEKSVDDWIRNILTIPSTGPPLPMSLIKKALKYSSCVPQRKIVKGNDNSDFLKCVRIQIKDANTLETEYYIIGATGEIQQYLISNNLMADSQKDILEINETVCCWYKRDKFVNSLRIKKISPKALKFIKKSHKCPVNKCGCCCQPCVKSEIGNVTFKCVVTSEYPIHTSDFVNKVTCVKIKFTRYQRPKNNEGDSAVENKTNTNKGAEQTRLTEELKSEDIDLSDLELSSTEEDTSTPLDPTNDVPTNIVGVVDNTNNNTDSNEPDSAQVEMLVNSILERFRDVRLKINADGKIAAELNTPINSLSTAELKVLGNILTHAQQQVDALGLIPGTNFNFGLGPNTLADKNVPPNQSKPNNNTKPPIKTVKQPINVVPDKLDLIGRADKAKTLERKNPSIYNHLSHLAALKRQNYLEAFVHHLNPKQKMTVEATIENISTPTINKVFSLAENMPTTSEQTTETDTILTLWSKKTKASGVKRKNTVNGRNYYNKIKKSSKKIDEPSCSKNENQLLKDCMTQQHVNLINPANTELLQQTIQPPHLAVPLMENQTILEKPIGLLNPLFSQASPVQLNSPMLLVNQPIGVGDLNYFPVQSNTTTQIMVDHDQNPALVMDPVNKQGILINMLSQAALPPPTLKQFLSSTRVTSTPVTTKETNILTGNPSDNVTFYPIICDKNGFNVEKSDKFKVSSEHDPLTSRHVETAPAVDILRKSNDEECILGA